MSGSAPDIVSLEEALDALAAPSPLERFATAHGHPLFVVDWPGPDDPVASTVAKRSALLATKLESLPCVTLALCTGSGPAVLDPFLSSFDVVVSGADALTAVRETVRRQPLASLVFVQLLRGSGRRSIEDGLVAESMAYSLLQSGPEYAAWRSTRPARVNPDEPRSPVVLEREGALLSIELDRPLRHNAFSRDMRDALCEAFELALLDDEIERVVWSGRGDSFCSGGDLDEFGSFPDPVFAHAIRTTRSPARLAAGIAAKLEVRVHGACIGAGVELPAFAHRVIAAPDARFALPELSLGLVPGAGGTVSLPRRIGKHATARLGLTGEQWGAEQALAIGLVDAIEESETRGSH